MSTPHADRDWRNIPPVPAGLAEAVEGSREPLTEYVLMAFERAFAERPLEVTYESFPEGLFAGLVVRRIRDEHNVWGVLASSALRGASIDVSIFVRGRSELEEAADEHRASVASVNGRMRARRARP